MRSFLALVSALLLSASVSADVPWITFSDPYGKFTVMFPIQPTWITTSLKGPNGITVPVTQYVGETADHQAAMVMADGSYSGLNIPPQVALDAIEAAFHGDKYTLLNSGPDTLDGQTGITLVLMDSNGYRITNRVFFISDHLYQTLSVVGPTSSPADIADAQRFSQSLHFTQAISRVETPSTIITTGAVDDSCLASAEKSVQSLAQNFTQASRSAELALSQACTVLQTAPGPSH